MSRSNDAGHFFQTETSLNESKRKAAKAENDLGDPIKLPSKILAVVAHPRDEQACFIAESAGNIKLIRLNTEAKLNNSNQIQTVYKGANGPLTSLATSQTDVYAGSWDCSVHACSIDDFNQTKRFADGHSDFVKCVAYTCVESSDSEKVELLLSGGADGYIVVWNARSAEKLHVLRGHSRGVLDLVVQPILSPHAQSMSAILWSAGSDRTIRRWLAKPDEAKALAFMDPKNGQQAQEQLIVHDTGVNRLRFYHPVDEHGSDPNDTSIGLATASSDKSARCFQMKSVSQSKEEVMESQSTPNLIATFQHPDFVNDILLLSEGELIATACRDEMIRIWDADDTYEPFAVFDGHFEEVTGFCVRRLQSQDFLISVSIDGTVRKWPIDRHEISKWKTERKLETEGLADNLKAKEQEKPGFELTAEEEAELAELMEDE